MNDRKEMFMIPTYEEFINNSEFDFNNYDEEVKFELLEDNEVISQVMDTSLEDAIQFFRDNFEGNYTINFEGNTFKIIL